MATTKKSETATPAPKLPEFEDHSDLEMVGWWDPDLEKEIVGRLMGAVTIQGKRGARIAYQVKTAKPMSVATKNEDSVPAAVGDIIGVSERYQLRKLREYVDSKPMIRLAYGGERDTSGGTMKLFNIGIEKGARRGAPYMPIAASSGGDASAPDDDDIPF